MCERDQHDKQGTNEKAAEIQAECWQTDEGGGEGSDIESAEDQGSEEMDAESISIEMVEGGGSTSPLSNDGGNSQSETGHHASSGAPVDSEAGECTRDNLGATKYQNLNKKFIAVVVTFVVCAAIIGVTIFNNLMVGMPEICGMVPSEANEELLGLSESWAVEYATDEGEEVTIESLEDYVGYEVKETEPNAGTLLSRSDESARIQVTIGKTEETLRKERQAIIDAEIADSLANGFEREEHEDGGSYVLFRAYRSDPVPMDGSYYPPPTDFEGDDSNVGLYRNMAATLRSSVICACYTQDGYMTVLYYAPYSDASEEDLAADAEVLRQLVQEAIASNRDRAKTFLANWCGCIQEEERAQGRPLTCEYTLESDTAAIYEMYDWADMIHTGNAREINESRAKDQAQANWLAWCLGREISVLTYTSENELFDSFEAEADAYSPLVVIDPAPEAE